jgi:hypothetical protein
MDAQPKSKRAACAIAIGKRSMSVTDLPASDTRRWYPRQKSMVVTAVDVGLITLEEACQRYDLSGEEFLSWQCATEEVGVLGLRMIERRERREKFKASVEDALRRKRVSKALIRRRRSIVRLGRALDRTDFVVGGSGD